jgi:hypothetical protein
MKISKTKIKFTDIAGMLDRDQMREITGGCGVSTGSAMTIQSGGLGCSASWSNTSSCWSSITGMGFGGALSYGGVSASSLDFRVQVQAQMDLLRVILEGCGQTQVLV